MARGYAPRAESWSKHSPASRVLQYRNTLWMRRKESASRIAERRATAEGGTATNGASEGAAGEGADEAAAEGADVVTGVYVKAAGEGAETAAVGASEGAAAGATSIKAVRRRR